MLNAVDELQKVVRTRHSIVRIDTSDEGHVRELIRRAGGRMSMPVLVWTITDGLRWIEPSQKMQVPNTNSLTAALAYLRKDELRALFVFCDSLRLLTRAADVRLMREVGEKFSEGWSTLFLVDPGGDMPVELERMVVPYDVPLPDEAELRKLVRETFYELRMLQDMTIDLDETQFTRFIQTLRGLTHMEVRHLLAQCLLDDDHLNEKDLARVVDLKRRRLGETGVLEFIPTDDAPAVGGMRNLRRWLKLRAEALTPEARKYGLESPRGILLLGVQGCGKSVMARATAAKWKMPLLRLDVGALYDKYIGETEKHLRKAFAQAGAMAPCVLWIDEIEKAFASAASHSVDGGLSQRMFGSLLTWLQDHTDPIFVVATANDISALPPELMRKGRFDEVFFVDLPGDRARAQIAAIHLRRRKRDYHSFDVKTIALACEGFSGAEIEQAIVSGMYAAFAQRREITTEDIIAEMRRTRPLSVTAAEKVAELRAWAAGRCVMANGKE